MSSILVGPALIFVFIFLVVLWLAERSERKKQESMFISANNDALEANKRADRIEWERYCDFAIYWEVSERWVETAFVTLGLDKEEDFRTWTRTEFLGWYHQKLAEEGINLGYFTSKIEDRAAQMIDDLFK